MLRITLGKQYSIWERLFKKFKRRLWYLMESALYFDYDCKGAQRMWLLFLRLGPKTRGWINFGRKNGKTKIVATERERVGPRVKQGGVENVCIIFTLFIRAIFLCSRILVKCKTDQGCQIFLGAKKPKQGKIYQIATNYSECP
jgi:hypothetical protein